MVKSTARLFADDCLLYKSIKNPSDADQLQRDLDSLQNWEKTWLMSFNPEKCEVLRVTNKRSPITHDYEIHGTTLKIAETAKYLGLNIDKKLSWNHHINSITKKANSTIAFLRRNISTCPSTIKSKCYTTIVRPILEYACVVWDPTTDKYIKQLEMVQRKAARVVVGEYRTTSSVTRIIEKLHWPTLQQRRKQAKTTMLFKITKGLVDVDSSRLKPTSTANRTRGHCHRFQIPTSKLRTHQQSFFPSTIRLWNKLPANMVRIDNLDKFGWKS